MPIRVLSKLSWNARQIVTSKQDGSDLATGTTDRGRCSIAKMADGAQRAGIVPLATTASAWKQPGPARPACCAVTPHTIHHTKFPSSQHSKPPP